MTRGITALLGFALLWVGATVVAAPGIHRESRARETAEGNPGVYVLQNEALRAEVKYSELYRLTYVPTGHELMSPGWHGVLNLCAKEIPPGKTDRTWLFQDSMARRRSYRVEETAREATLIISFDWVPRPTGQPPFYTVTQRLTLFADRPYLRVRYAIVAKQPPSPGPDSFMIQSSGTSGTHLVEPGRELRVESLTDTRLGGMASDPHNYWFALWDQPSKHFTAFLRPGQTDPTRCMFAKGQWYVSRWSEPFLDTPGQSYREELWIVAGTADQANPDRIVDAAHAGHAFAARRKPILATLLQPYVTHDELVRKTAHLRADGKGTTVVFKNERLYVDGKPFLFFAPWGIDHDMWKLYRKYHLTGVFGQVRNADLAHKHGLKIVPSALEWPHKRGKALEEHIRHYVDHPAIVAWFLQDDFGGGLDMLGNIEIIRRVDPHRPTVADVVGYDAGRRQASAFLDINSPYTYPAPIHTYRWYADYLEHDQKIMERQFNWTCPQAASYSAFARTGQPTEYFLDYPTAAQMRLQTYLGLAHGIRGFMYWPVRGIRDYKLSELGIVCAEVEGITDLIVEADRNPAGAVTDNAQIEVQRLDVGDCTLLFLINYREKSERWPTGELASAFTVTVKTPANARQRQLHSFTLDQDLVLGAPVMEGADVTFTVAGLDVAALVVLASETVGVRGRRQQLEALAGELTQFARTTNAYMAQKVFGLLGKLGAMRAPTGSAAQLYNEAIRLIESETTFTGQRRAARALRNAMGNALAEADALADYAPRFARNSLLINVWTLPQFMASFNFRALKQETMRELSAPPAIRPMKPVPEPKPARPLEVGRMVAGSKTPEVFAVPLRAGASYCLVQHARGRALHAFADAEACRTGRNDFVGLPNDNLDLSVTLVRPGDITVHVAPPKGLKSFGVIQAASLAVGAEQQSPSLTAQAPVALYDVPGRKGDSFEVTVQASTGCVLDLLLCQAYPRHGQVLASGRVTGTKPAALQCTLPDDTPLTMVVQRVKGDGACRLDVREIDAQVVPRKTVNPFAGVRFAIYGTDTCNFPEVLAAHWISGDQLMGSLAQADLRSYDVLVLLTNAIKYDEADELQANADRLKTFVKQGGGMVVFQQNGRETWDSTILPYPMTLVLTATTNAPVLANDQLFAGVTPGDFANGVNKVVYYPVDVAETDAQWHCLAYADQNRAQGAMAACRFGKGRVVVNQFAVLDRIGEPVMRSLMVDTVRYVLGTASE